MSTSNIEELMALADRYATLRIGKGTANARKELQYALQSQEERIAELERESETHAKAYGLAIVERDNLRHELKTAQEGWRCECSTDDACRFARERDALRAQLAAIAATEPVAWIDEYGNAFPLAARQYSTVGKGWKPLFTRPMPAQDAEIAAIKSALRTTIRTYVVDDDAWDTERETERFMKRAIDAAIEGAKR